MRTVKIDGKRLGKDLLDFAGLFDYGCTIEIDNDNKVISVTGSDFHPDDDKDHYRVEKVYEIVGGYNDEDKFEADMTPMIEKIIDEI